VKDDPDAPHVTLFVVLLLQDLRRNVGRRAKPLAHHLVLLKHSREPEVNHFDLVDAILHLEENVLRLEVSMHNALVVKVVHCQEYLLDYLGCNRLIDLLALLNHSMDVTASQVLHYQVHVVRVLVDVKQFDNAGVIEASDNRDLVHQALEVTFVAAFLEDYLHSSCLTSDLVDDLLDLSIATLA